MNSNCTRCNASLSLSETYPYDSIVYCASCREVVIHEEKVELADYICKLFGLKQTGPNINQQIKTFVFKHPLYTYKGMLWALKYFYEVRNGKKERSNEMVGIIPYVYEAAQLYYQDIENKSNKVVNNVQYSKPTELQIHSAVPRKKIRECANPDEVGEMDD